MSLNGTCFDETMKVSYLLHLESLRRLYLQVSKLSKLLAAIVKLAGERLNLLVYDLVCSNVPTLCECLATDVALIRAFTGVTSFVRLVEC